jgi:hypothetical protein
LITKEKTKEKKPKQKREKSTSTKGHYVTNGVLLPAVIEAKAGGKVTDKLIRMIQMIAERYSRKANFIGYSFREDMVSAAVMNLCNNALKFNPEKSNNPFSYYTTGIHNSFLQYLADEKKHRNIRDALLIDAGSNPSYNFGEGEKEEVHFEIKESDEYFLPELDENEIAELDAEAATVLKVDAVPAGDVEFIPKTPKEAKLRYQHRVPGPVTRYGPKDIEIDADGNITIKPKPEPKPKKVRSVPAKATPVAKAQKASTVHKVVSVKKPAAKKVIEKPAKKVAVKKVVAKKTAK